MMHHSAKRISILGSPGSGKTTFSRSYHAEMDLPLFSLDDLYWGPEWTRPPKEDWLNRVHSILAHDEFIIEGGYIETIEMRIKRSDLVILIDAPTWICIIRYLYRVIQIASGNLEKLPKNVRQRGSSAPTPKGDLFRMIRKILFYRRSIYPLVLKLAEAYNVPVYIVDAWGKTKSSIHPPQRINFS